MELIYNGSKCNLHSTYSPDRYYIDLGDLPKDLIENLFKAENIQVDETAYTVYEATAFLRLTVELENNETIEIEYHLGLVSDEAFGEVSESYESHDNRAKSLFEYTDFDSALYNTVSIKAY